MSVPETGSVFLKQVEPPTVFVQ